VGVPATAAQKEGKRGGKKKSGVVSTSKEKKKKDRKLTDLVHARRPWIRKKRGEGTPHPCFPLRGEGRGKGRERHDRSPAPSPGEKKEGSLLLGKKKKKDLKNVTPLEKKTKKKEKGLPVGGREE